MTPNDLLPAWALNPNTDWYSFAGNACSIFGLALSCAGLWITLLVKRQVKNIEREYVMRLKNRDWVLTIRTHQDALLAIYGGTPFQLDEARIELTKVSSLISSLRDQLPSSAANAFSKALNQVNQHRERSRWWHPRPTLDAGAVFDVYLCLTEISENLIHSVSRTETAPIR